MKQIRSLLIRYIILLAISIPNLYLFYLIFTPLTTYPVYFTLDILKINSAQIILIPACIAGSAYYLLLILNLSTPNIKNRVKLITAAFFSLLILNVFRIVLLAILYTSNSPFFDATHKILWYAGSTILIIAIWFTQVKIYKIKDIPIYSDIKYIIQQIK